MLAYAWRTPHTPIPCRKEFLDRPWMFRENPVQVEAPDLEPGPSDLHAWNHVTGRTSSGLLPPPQALKTTPTLSRAGSLRDGTVVSNPP